jgi:hypothetical protein
MHQKGMSAGRCPRHAIVRLFAAVSRLGCVRPNGQGSAAPPHWIGKAFEPVPAFKMALILLAAKRRPLQPVVRPARWCIAHNNQLKSGWDFATMFLDLTRYAMISFPMCAGV